ncbi:MAG: hypothetical protein ACRD9L_16245 [Bryobacteraceae bacterium]
MSGSRESAQRRRIEQRREIRFPASGEVRLWLDDESQEIEGRLIDVSAGGFRATHNFASLGSGQLVRFRHLAAGGKARVIWNRIVGRKVETGFLVL